MKRIKLNIFWKTFLFTIVMLLLMTMAAYILLYSFLPYYYEKFKTEEYQALAAELLDSLEHANDSAAERDLLNMFAAGHTVELTLTDKDGTVIHSYTVSQEITVELNNDDYEETDSTSLSIGEEQAATDTQELNITLDFSYQRNQELRYLQIVVPLQPLTEARTVIINIYPAAVLICVLFAFLLASVFSYAFVRPIRTIRKATRAMAGLEPDAFIPVTTRDEIGDLSEDINQLYQELTETIDTLKQEISRYSDAENKKIDFLRTVSHELKTPLASANALIEGIIYGVPPYDQNQKEYLSECQTFLQTAITLTKESLSLSRDTYKEEITPCNISELIREISSGYRVILRSRQISWSETLPDTVYINTRRRTFSKALSNIISNAASYTPKHGEITVSYIENYAEEKRMLIIENTCRPLTEEELAHIFKPFYSGQKKDSMSTGLGLYIVSQLFHLLHTDFSFAPMESGKGMRFTIYLHDLKEQETH